MAATSLILWREQLVIDHMPMAQRIAHKARRRFATPNVEIDDLEQLAMLGLVESAGRYDPGTGVPFEAYALRRVWGRIYDQYRRGKFRDESHEALPDDLEGMAAVADDELMDREVSDEVLMLLYPCRSYTQARIVLLHFGMDWSIGQLGAHYHKSRRWVRRQLKDAKERLRDGHTKNDKKANQGA